MRTADVYSLILGALEDVRSRGVRPASSVTQKSDGSLVTEVDLWVQARLTSYLQEHSDFPILGEEGGQLTGEPDGPFWSVDPIDGTTNFSRGVPVYACSIALVEGRTSIAGGVWDIPRDVVHLSAEATPNPWPSAVDLSELRVGIDYEGSSGERRVGAQVISEAIERCRSVRVVGSTALGATWCGLGYFDVFFHPRPHLWDYAAAVAIGEKAGATVLSPELGGESDYLLMGQPGAVGLVREIVEMALSQEGPAEG